MQFEAFHEGAQGALQPVVQQAAWAKGTLWQDRYRSVLVEDGEALQTMAAYIDLNPVRAGLVDDPTDYRWSGYAEAIGGSKRACRALCVILGVTVANWKERGLDAYRRLFLGEGIEAGGEVKP